MRHRARAAAGGGNNDWNPTVPHHCVQNQNLMRSARRGRGACRLPSQWRTRRAAPREKNVAAPTTVQMDPKEPKVANFILCPRVTCGSLGSYSADRTRRGKEEKTKVNALVATASLSPCSLSARGAWSARGSPGGSRGPGSVVCSRWPQSWAVLGRHWHRILLLFIKIVNIFPLTPMGVVAPH